VLRNPHKLRRASKDRAPAIRQRGQSSSGSSGPHILEGKVFELISVTMTDPRRLRGCMSKRETDGSGTTKALHRLAKKIGALDDERRQLNYRYAADQIPGDEFIAARRALDKKRERLVVDKSKLAAERAIKKL
jgi:hypothetical protein